jgi:hypothetical protein
MRKQPEFTFSAPSAQAKSWVVQEESAKIPRVLGLSSNSAAFEIGCGSGGYALHVSRMSAAESPDINASGIENANQLARARGLDERCLLPSFASLMNNFFGLAEKTEEVVGNS